MKCLIEVDTGRVMPDRYKDRLAASLVKTGRYRYCAKQLWKDEVRDVAKKETVTEEPIKKKKKKKKKGRRVWAPQS